MCWNTATRRMARLRKGLLPGVAVFFVTMFAATSLASADWMDIPSDKRLHFKGGLCLSSMIYTISRFEGSSREESFVQGFSIGTLAGILYELVWDDLIYGRKADWEDSLYVTLGSATGSAVCASLDYVLFRELSFRIVLPF